MEKQQRSAVAQNTGQPTHLGKLLRNELIRIERLRVERIRKQRYHADEVPYNNVRP